MSCVAKSIPAEHKDLIHDVSFDFYGKRMATCSSDLTVKIWDRDGQGEWHCTANWRAHSGSVWKVTWGHPVFGQVIATCSFDRTAKIWEENCGADMTPGVRNQSHWDRKISFVDSRTSVTDIKFAPKHLGLLLAMCSADGVVRIYEAPDVMNLTQWSLQFEIPCKLPCSCVTWNPSLSRLHPPMIAVGSDDPSQSVSGKVFIYEMNERTRRWTKLETITSITEPVHDIAFAPNPGRQYHILGVASKDVQILTLKPLQTDIDPTHGGSSLLEVRLAGKFDDHTADHVWRVSWNVIGTILLSSGDDGYVRMWKANYLGKWSCISSLRGDGMMARPDSYMFTPQITSSGVPSAKYYKLGPVIPPPPV